MSPECFYWVALATLVLPSVAFNGLAAVVLLSWAFGYATYLMGPFDNAACMFANIIALGAALAVSRPWDGSRRAIAQTTVALMFIPTALLSAVAAIYFERPPQTMGEYYWQSGVYWATWGVIMAQAVLVPVGNDWDKIKATAHKADKWIMARIVKHFGDAL